MDDVFGRFWGEIFGRTSGLLWFRFILQPTVATILAAIAGIRDAKSGRPVFLWSIVTNAAERRYLIQDGWKDVAKVFLLACVLDIVYSVIVFHAVRPVQTLVVAIALAIVPYVLFRGPISRIVRIFATRTGSP